MLNKKTIVGLAVLSLSMLSAANSNAATHGAYFGAQAGYGNVHQKASQSDLEGWTKETNKDTGVAGRLFGGYQINKNFAAEMGWTKFSNAEVKASAYDGGITGKGTVKTDAVDLVAKGIYPVGHNVNVYGKAGAAYVMQRYDKKIDVFGLTEKGNETKKKLLPTFGAGVSYDFTQNVAADLSYNRIQKTGSSNYIKSTDLVSVGLIYSIG